MNKFPVQRIAVLLFVAVVWAAMLVAALGLVRTYGTRTLPQSDELWVLYDAGPGIHVSWLWRTWAEHRIPLAKLIWKSVLQFTDYDFRAGDFLTVLLLSVPPVFLIWAARQVRGRVILSDAFLPLAVLNFGQAQVMLWWWQINHVLAPVTAGLVLALLVIHGNSLRPRHAAVIAAGLILFALCGTGGLPYVLALAFWFIVWSAAQWPSFDRYDRRQWMFAAATVVVALAFVAFYFVDYKPYFPVNDPPTMSSWPPSPGWYASGVAYLEILALSLGTATKSHAVVYGVGVLLFIAISTASLIRVWFTRPDERWRAFSLAVLLGSQVVVIAFIAWSRAGMGLDYLYSGHYLTIAAPALCCLYFMWEIKGGRAGRLVQFGMMVVLALLVRRNFHEAKLVGKDIQRTTEAFEHDVRSGMPASVIAQHLFTSDVVPRADKLTQILQSHKANGVGIFKQIRDDPPYHFEKLPLESAVSEGMALHLENRLLQGAGGSALSWSSADGRSSLTFSLAKREHLYGVRLHYGYINSVRAFPAVRVYWRDSTTEDFTDQAPLPAGRMFAFTVSGPDQPTWALIDGKIHVDAKVRSDRVLTVWIDAVIDQIRIYPDFAPCDFRLSGIELMRSLSRVDH